MENWWERYFSNMIFIVVRKWLLVTLKLKSRIVLLLMGLRRVGYCNMPPTFKGGATTKPEQNCCASPSDRQLTKLICIFQQITEVNDLITHSLRQWLALFLNESATLNESMEWMIRWLTHYNRDLQCICIHATSELHLTVYVKQTNKQKKHFRCSFWSFCAVHSLLLLILVLVNWIYWLNVSIK